MSEVVKCGWRNCEIELTRGHYCTPSHKNKARVARNKKPTPPEKLAEYAGKSSGFVFAKAMEGAERLAAREHSDPGTVKTLVMRSLQKRINNYLADLEAEDA